MSSIGMAGPSCPAETVPPVHDHLRIRPAPRSTTAVAVPAAAAVDRLVPCKGGEPAVAYLPDPLADADGDGLTDAARVGCPGGGCEARVQRLAGLPPAQAAFQEAAARRFERDPDALADQVIALTQRGEIGDGGNVLSADSCKAVLGEAYNPRPPADLPQLQKERKVLRADLQRCQRQLAALAMEEDALAMKREKHAERRVESTKKKVRRKAERKLRKKEGQLAELAQERAAIREEQGALEERMAAVEAPLEAHRQALKEARCNNNLPAHQTAIPLAHRALERWSQAIAEQYQMEWQAFEQHRAKHPEAEAPAPPRLAVILGGCAAGKGRAIKGTPEVQETVDRASLVYDTAGEQNGTELKMMLALARRHGFALDVIYVDRDPDIAFRERTVERAHKNGRMVDARLSAESHVIGARNFEAFFRQHRDEADISFRVVDGNEDPPVLHAAGFQGRLPSGTAERDLDRLVRANQQYVIDHVDPQDPVYRGGYAIGAGIWGGIDGRGPHPETAAA